jgi:hypothetical protein
MCTATWSLDMATLSRSPLILYDQSAHAFLPEGEGSGIWYPQHGDLLPGLVGYPALIETVIAGTAKATKWTDRVGAYSYPVDNGNTSQVFLRATDDVDDLFIDGVLSLRGAPVGTHLVLAGEVSFNDQLTNAGTIMSYGMNTATNGGLTIQLTTGELLEVSHRGVGDGTSISGVWGGVTGTAFTAYANQGLVPWLVGIQVQNANPGTFLLGVESWWGTPALGFGWRTGTITPSGAATFLEGYAGGSFAQMGDLKFGARGASAAPAYDQYLGRGAGSNMATGNFQAFRYPVYSATRLANLWSYASRHLRDYWLYAATN